MRPELKPHLVGLARSELLLPKASNPISLAAAVFWSPAASAARYLSIERRDVLGQSERQCHTQEGWIGMS